MSRYCAVKDGLFSNSTDVWARCGTGSTFHASTATTDILGTPVDTDTFTAPNTTNYAVGVIVYASSNTQVGDYTATLQEYDGANWVDKATATCTMVANSPSYLLFVLATPYQYTTTTANYYRYSIVRTTATGSLFRLRTRSTGTKAGIIPLDDRFAAPTDGDEIMVIGKDNGSTSITTSFDGTQTIGNFGSTSRSVEPTVTTQAILIDGGGAVQADTAGSAQLTIKGMVAMNGGTFAQGSTSVAYPAGQTAKILFNQNGTSGNYGIWTQGSTTTPCVVTMNGQDPTGYSATVTSGVGTAASPLITSGDIGVVGDEVCFPASAVYDQTEYKFIKTKNSATSYVLSATAGGAESALSYTHTYAANMTRNVSIESTDSSMGWYAWMNNSGTYRTNIWFENTVFKHVGGSSTTGAGQISIGYSSGSSTVNLRQLTGCVFTESQRQPLYLFVNTASENEWTDNLFCRGNQAASQNHINFRGSNQILRRWFMVECRLSGLEQGSGYNNRLYDIRISGCNQSNNSVHAGLIHSGVSGSNTWYDLSIQACRTQSVYIGTTTLGTVYEGAIIGTIGASTTDLVYVSDILVTQVFKSSTFGSATLQSNVTGLYAGSAIGFHRYQDTDRRHRTYQPNINLQSTGSSLTDTTADTTFDADSLAMRVEPLNTTGSSVEFQMPQRAGNTIIFSGKLYKTAAFNGTCRVELYLDGSDTADDTYTLSGSDSTWIPFVLSADYTAGTIDRNAKIVVYTNGTAGYVYLDTLFNASKATNPIGSLDLWQDGRPNSYLVSTVASASEIAGAVWSDNTVYDAGTKGKAQDDTLANTDVTQAKVDQL